MTTKQVEHVHLKVALVIQCKWQAGVTGNPNKVKLNAGDVDK